MPMSLIESVLHRVTLTGSLMPVTVSLTVMGKLLG